MEWSEENLERLRKEAWQEGYDAAMEKLRMALKLKNMGLADCEIVKRTELPPFIVHGIFGEQEH
jgi:hypothetical protein